jgi:glycosyltransferase involved in cell wall biosynthesis
LSKEATVNLSVIIPVYKAGAHFARLITALAEQETNFNYEILIADDGSPDDTVARILRHIQSLSTPSVKLLPLSKNTGPAGARNCAISHAKGEAFVLIDADCMVISKDYLAHIFRAHQQHPRAIIGGGVQGRGKGVMAFGDRYCHWGTNVPGKPPAPVESGHMVTANMIIPREVFEKIGPFDASLRTGEDSAFCIKARANRIELRLHGDCIVAHQDRETLRDFLSCLYWVGRDRADSRKAAYGRTPFYLAGPAVLRWILAPLIACALTAKNLRAWWP